MITGFLLRHSLLLVSLVGVLATFLIGWERAVLRKRHHQGKRVSKQVLNQPGGNIIPLRLARGGNRRGRIRDRRAKPAGIWAQASKRKRGEQEAAPAMNARSAARHLG